jgi:proline dehydrogenase
VAVLNRALVRLLPAVPRPVVRKISERYIAGTELADATRAVRELNGRGVTATIDVLGEEVTSADEARAISQAYVDVFHEIERERLDSTVSVKPTALGLKLSPELCAENLDSIVRCAAERANFVTIDMEDSSTTDDTLALYRRLRADGHDNVGIVLQASLRRTVDDVGALADLRPHTRICKGIYVESEAIQFHDYGEVRRAYVRALEALVDSGCYVGIATHDEWLVEEGRRLVRDRGLGREDYEFQMLLGVRPAMGQALVREGHRLRVYVPFGRQWYEYSLRRLQENPKIAGYVAADTFGRMFARRNGA